MSQLYHTQKQAGFTLIEVLLYVSIISSILLVMSAFVGTMLASNAKNTTVAEVEQQGSQAMSLIEENVQDAVAITTPSAGVIGSSLSLTMPANSPAVFGLSGGTITITEAGGSPVALTSPRVTASDLTFTNLSGASGQIVRVQFTLTYINNSGRNEFDYNKNFVTSVSTRR